MRSQCAQLERRPSSSNSRKSTRSNQNQKRNPLRLDQFLPRDQPPRGQGPPTRSSRDALREEGAPSPPAHGPCQLLLCCRQVSQSPLQGPPAGPPPPHSPRGDPTRQGAVGLSLISSLLHPQHQELPALQGDGQGRKDQFWKTV